MAVLGCRYAKECGGTKIKKKKISERYGWVIVILMCLGIFVPNYAHYQMTALGPRLIEAIQINPSQLSSILTSSMVPGIFFSFIAGLLVDRFGAKRILSISFLITAIGAVMRIWADSFTSMYIAMMLLGFHSTFLNANGSKVFGYWFPPEKVAKIMGIFIAVVNGSMALGMGTGALYPGLESAFTVSAAMIIVGVILWMIFAKDRKVQSGETQHTPTVTECLKVVMKNKNVWITGLVLMLLLSGSIALNMFLPTALVSGRGFSEARAGAVGMAIMFGSAVSCFITPILDGKIKKTRYMMAVYGVLGVIGTAFAWRAPEGVPLIAALFMTGFVTTGLSPIITSIPIQLPDIGPKYAGTAGGIIATIQLIGTVVIPTYIITPISGSNYTLMFYLCGAVVLLFTISTRFLPDMRSEAMDSNVKGRSVTASAEQA